MDRRHIISYIAALTLLAVLASGVFYRARFMKNPSHWGETMGTGYSVKISGRIHKKKLAALLEQIEAVLAEVNRQMSTWDPDSEISRFNHSSAMTEIPCSAGFLQVVDQALQLSKSTDGAFDPTLQPLLNLWGFGSEGEERRIPSDREIESARQKTGWQKVIATHTGLTKTEPHISLALGAIAKGYGVDAVADVMKTNGLKDWFVEIGGEVVVSGLNPEGVPWKVGIQNPTTNPMDQSLQGIVHLTGGAVATSGDYRNYIEHDGNLYSHILDPRSGQTVLSDTASVSVYAGNCMVADGIATALFVMGYEEGLKWVEKQNGVEALFLIRTGNGEIIRKNSSGFETATGYIETFNL